MRLRLAFCLLACSTALAARDYVTERYDVQVRVLPDASLWVAEVVRFGFRGGPFTFLSWELRTEGTDRISDLRAWMDEEAAKASVEWTETGQLFNGRSTLRRTRNTRSRSSAS